MIAALWIEDTGNVSVPTVPLFVGPVGSLRFCATGEFNTPD